MPALSLRCLVVSSFLTTLAFGQAGIITTYAGNGNRGFSGDGGQATSAMIGGQAVNLAVDSSGTLFFADVENGRIRKVSASGVITTVVSTRVNNVAVDSAGNLFMAATGNIQKYSTTGMLSTIAGGLLPGYGGDGGPAANAMLNATSVTVDGAGNLYIADTVNNRIRKIDTNLIITTIAGTGTAGFSGDGGPATAARLSFPQGIISDAAGNIYFADALNSRVRKISTDGIITTIAGNGSSLGIGENVPATSVGMTPSYVALDGAGNVYVSDTGTHRIRKINTAGFISTFAGGNGPGFSGDGGPATSARLFGPTCIASDSAGNVYISDLNNYRIRKVASGSTDATVLSVTPAALTFTYALGGSTPPAQTLNAISSNLPLNITAAGVTSSGGSWLNVTASSNTTPATISASLNASVLATLTAGTYRATITVTPSGASTTPVLIGVTLTVTSSGSSSVTLSAVLNALGYQAKLAPDTVFVGFGSGMGPATLTLGNGPNYPDSLAGTSITFTPAAGGAAIVPMIVYTSAGQLAGLLPSSITPGSYFVRVTYNGQTSGALGVTVVPRSFGIATANSAGSGTAQATIGNVNGGLSLTRLASGSVSFNGYDWVLTPAHPNDTLVLWGTGGGADPANDTGGSSGDQTAAGNFVVIVGGRRITPLYAGASTGYPGLWQINFTLPADVPTGCTVFLQVSANGELSNVASLPIAAAGQSICAEPNVPPAIISKLASGSTITMASFAVARITDTPSGISQESSGGFIGRYTAAAWMLAAMGPRFEYCTIYDRTYPVGGLDPASPTVTLNVGANMTLTGANIATSVNMAPVGTPLGPSYIASITPGTIVLGGSYTMDAPGGTQVGPFRATAQFPVSFNATNFASITSIDRSRPLTVNWTGSGFESTDIMISTATRTGGNQRITTLECVVPMSLGSYSVPLEALALLQPAAATGTNFGSFSVGAMSAAATFTATLTAGGQIDYGAFVADLIFGKNIAVQ